MKPVDTVASAPYRSYRLKRPLGLLMARIFLFSTFLYCGQ